MNLLRRAVALCFVAAIPLVLQAQPAGASLDDPCNAFGTIDGVTYDPKAQDEATIPRKGVVLWQGNVPGRGERVVEGKVYAKIGPTQVNVGTWDGPGEKHRSDGDYDYDFPSVLAGLKIPVSGHHTEPGINCAGRMVVQLEGSKWSNPILLGSIALTIVCVVNVGLAVRAKKVTA